MRPVTGPLQSGTYIVEMVEDSGIYPTVKDDRSKFALTNDHQGAKWIVEKVGNDLYRVATKDTNMRPIHNPGQDKLTWGEELTEWIIRETDVPGEYSGSPAGRPDLYVYAAERGEDYVEGKLGAERMTRVRLFRVDE